MKTLLLPAVLTVLLGTAASAQVAIPATPKNFTKRPISTTSSNSGSINFGPTQPPAETKVRYTTHIALSQPRQWQSADGKSLLGSLIAFEDLTAETVKGAPAPTFTPPANPTVVKDGKARLMVNQKPYEIALDRLSQPDQEFIENIRTAAAKKAAAAAKP